MASEDEFSSCTPDTSFDRTVDQENYINAKAMDEVDNHMAQIPDVEPDSELLEDGELEDGELDDEPEPFAPRTTSDATSHRASSTSPSERKSSKNDVDSDDTSKKKHSSRKHKHKHKHGRHRDDRSRSKERKERRKRRHHGDDDEHGSDDGGGSHHKHKHRRRHRSPNKNPPGPYDSPDEEREVPVSSRRDSGSNKYQSSRSPSGGGPYSSPRDDRSRQLGGERSLASMVDDGFMDNGSYVDVNVAANEKQELYHEKGRKSINKKKLEKNRRYLERQAEREKEMPPPSKKEKTKLCKFFKDGHCNRGDNCTFSHDLSRPHQRRLEACNYYMKGICNRGDECNFMHEQFPCRFFHTGMECYHGDHCKFSHGNLSDELQAIVDKWIEDREDNEFITPRKKKAAVALSPNSTAEQLEKLKKIPSLFEIETFAPGENQDRYSEDGDREGSTGKNSPALPLKPNFYSDRSDSPASNKKEGLLPLPPASQKISPERQLSPDGEKFDGRNSPMEGLPTGPFPGMGPPPMGPMGPMGPIPGPIGPMGPMGPGPMGPMGPMNYNVRFPPGMGPPPHGMGPPPGMGPPMGPRGGLPPRPGPSLLGMPPPSMGDRPSTGPGMPPRHLPPRQQELYRRIQQQQHDNSNNLDDIASSAQAMMKQDDSYYSSDEETQKNEKGGKDQNNMATGNTMTGQMNAMLPPRLHTVPPPGMHGMPNIRQPPPNIRGTTPTQFNIAQMLNVIKQNASKNQSGSESGTRMDPRDPRAKADPRISNDPRLNTDRDPRRAIKQEEKEPDTPAEPDEPADNCVYVNCMESGIYTDLIPIDYEKRSQELPSHVNVLDEQYQKDPRIQKFTNTYVPMKRARRESSSGSGDENVKKQKPSTPTATPSLLDWEPPPRRIAAVPESYNPTQSLRKTESAPPVEKLYTPSKARAAQSMPAATKAADLAGSVTSDSDKMQPAVHDKAHAKLMAPPPLPDMDKLTDVTPSPPPLPALLANPPDDLKPPTLPIFGRQLSEPVVSDSNKPMLSHRYDPRFKKKSKNVSASSSSKSNETSSSSITSHIGSIGSTVTCSVSGIGSSLSLNVDNTADSDSSVIDKTITEQVKPTFNFYSSNQDESYTPSSIPQSDSATSLHTNTTDEPTMKDLFKQCDPTASPFL